MSEFIIHPAHSCFPLPDHLDNEKAVLAEPLSIAIWAADLAGIRKDMSIGILGSGPIGMCVLKVCRHLGVRDLFVTDKLEYRLKMAGESGAMWTGNPDTSEIVAGVLREKPEGLDVIFDCCGKQEAMDQAIELLKPGGKIMIVGIPEFDQWRLPADVIRRKEIGFQNVRRQNDRLQRALDLIAGDEIDVGPLITHRFKLEDSLNAFQLVSGYKDGVMKAMIEISS
jgi:L-iditol 2-dehydrogenase